MNENINFLNICRLCTREIDSLSEFDNIFSFCEYSVAFSDICMRFTDVKIIDDDNLPKTVCQECQEKLLDCYRFKLKCEESEEILSNEFKLSIKNENDVDEAEIGEIYIEIIPQNESEKDINPKSTTTESKRAKKSKTKSSIKIKSIAGRKMCEHCGLDFVSNSVLKRHLTTHTGQKDFICDICDNRFARKFHLEMHMRAHFKIKPHKCDTCEASFGTPSDLNRHKLIHNDEKKFSCSVCDRRFKRSTDVAKHMRCHTGRKPYHCQNCDKHYASHSGFMKHLRRYHPEIVTERMNKTKEKIIRENHMIAENYVIEINEINENETKDTSNIVY